MPSRQPPPPPPQEASTTTTTATTVMANYTYNPLSTRPPPASPSVSPSSIAVGRDPPPATACQRVWSLWRDRWRMSGGVPTQASVVRLAAIVRSTTDITSIVADAGVRVPGDLRVNEGLYLMPIGVEPRYDHPRTRRGGHFGFRAGAFPGCDPSAVPSLAWAQWIALADALLTGCIEDPYHVALGCSLVRKPDGFSLKLWVADAAPREHARIRAALVGLLKLRPSAVRYSPHSCILRNPAGRNGGGGGGGGSATATATTTSVLYSTSSTGSIDQERNYWPPQTRDRNNSSGSSREGSRQSSTSPEDSGYGTPQQRTPSPTAQTADRASHGPPDHAPAWAEDGQGATMHTPHAHYQPHHPPAHTAHPHPHSRSHSHQTHQQPVEGYWAEPDGQMAMMTMMMPAEGAEGMGMAMGMGMGMEGGEVATGGYPPVFTDVYYLHSHLHPLPHYPPYPSGPAAAAAAAAAAYAGMYAPSLGPYLYVPQQQQQPLADHSVAPATESKLTQTHHHQAQYPSSDDDLLPSCQPRSEAPDRSNSPSPPPVETESANHAPRTQYESDEEEEQEEEEEENERDPGTRAWACETDDSCRAVTLGGTGDEDDAEARSSAEPGHAPAVGPGDKTTGTTTKGPLSSGASATGFCRFVLPTTFAPLRNIIRCVDDGYPPPRAPSHPPAN